MPRGVVANRTLPQEVEIMRTRDKERLEPLLREMAKLKVQVKPLNDRYDELREKAFPLVEKAGDLYELDGIKAEITRPETWEVDPVKLQRKFGEKVNDLLTVSTSKFRKAFEAGTLGTKTGLRGIAKLVKKTPSFKISQK